MNFLFFDMADKVLFSRDDAESASWTVEEMSAQLLFPYIEGKAITRGMRIGFADPDGGGYQVFEVRKARTYEPDHYQEITAEHIAVAELTDDFTEKIEITDETDAAALAALLEGTLWSVGNVGTGANKSSGDISMGAVWEGVRTIESDWNVHIMPRVTVGPNGITHRYLDIFPKDGTFRGLVLSVDKNADEMGVTIDDTEVVTALYGYGQSKDNVPLTFKDVVWSQTSKHPAKPKGQEYIEDPAATAAYGRNGRMRVSYYQNSSIDDASVLLQKTWECLKASSEPTITIDCRVSDLYRLGYADEPIRLNDRVYVEMRQTGMRYAKDVVALTIDLIDPTATRATIGTYIPNIVYIDRDTNKKARGGGGGRGKTNAENEEGNVRYWLGVQGGLLTMHTDLLDKDQSILRQMGVDIDPETGVIIYARDNKNNLQSKLDVETQKISLLVTDDNRVKRAAIILAINDGVSSTSISADVIDIDGMVNKLTSKAVIAESLTSLTSLIVRGSNSTFEGSISAAGTIGANQGFAIGQNVATWQTMDVVTSVSTTRVASGNRYFALTDANMSGITGALSANPLNTVTGNTTKIYYLGRTPS